LLRLWQLLLRRVLAIRRCRGRRCRGRRSRSDDHRLSAPRGLLVCHRHLRRQAARKCGRPLPPNVALTYGKVALACRCIHIARVHVVFNTTLKRRLQVVHLVAGAALVLLVGGWLVEALANAG
jgi:hypothetical protein